MLLKSINKEQLYYLCDYRNITGNCLMFWRKGKGCSGYTYNLDDAAIFTESDAMKIHKNRKTDVPYPKDIIDSISHPHVDHQDLYHLTQDEPCTK